MRFSSDDALPPSTFHCTLSVCPQPIDALRPIASKLIIGRFRQPVPGRPRPSITSNHADQPAARSFGSLLMRLRSPLSSVNVGTNLSYQSSYAPCETFEYTPPSISASSSATSLYLSRYQPGIVVGGTHHR